MDFLNFDEYNQLHDILHTEPLWGSAILTAGEAGLRLGEILGLNQEDVNLHTGIITFRRAMWNGILGSLKGGRERKIPMTTRLATALRAEKHLKSDFQWSDDQGRSLTKKMAQRALERVCKRAGLRRVGWHCLRHSFCSHLAMRGAPPKAIQELAGHRSINTTMRYMHLAPESLINAIQLLNNRPKTVQGLVSIWSSQEKQGLTH